MRPSITAIVVLLLLVASTKAWSQQITTQAEAEASFNMALRYCGDPSKEDSLKQFLNPALDFCLQQQDEITWIAWIWKSSKALRSSGKARAVESLRQQALVAQQRSLSSMTQAKMLGLTGNELKRNGYFYEALHYFEEALVIFEQAKIENYFVGFVYHYAGNVYTRQGNYQDALVYLSKSLDIHKGLDNTEEVARAYADLGLVYIDLKDYKAAETSFAMGLQLQNVSTKQQGNLLYNQAFLWEQIGQPDSALHWNEAAKETFIQAGYQAGLGAAFKLEGALLEQTGQYQAALKAYDTALEYTLAVRGPFHREVAKIQLSRQAIFLRNEAFAQAQEACQGALMALGIGSGANFQIALPDTSELYPEPWLIHALTASGNTLQASKVGHVPTLQRALKAYLLAFSVADLLRQDYAADGDRSALLHHHFDAFSEAISLALHLAELLPNERSHYETLAFELSEHSRAYNLFNAIARANSARSEPVADSLLEQLRIIQASIWDTRRTFRQSVEEGAPTAPSSLEQQLLDLNRQREELEGQFEALFPSDYRIRQQVNFRSLPEIQAGLTPETMVLEYFKGKEFRYLFAITLDSMQVLRLPTDSSFSQVIQQFRQALIQPPQHLAPKAALKAFAEPATLLYQQLLEPILSNAGKKIQNLVLIPDAELADLPLDLCLAKAPEPETANFQNLAYLLREYTVSSHYSANLMIALAPKATPAKDQAPQLLFLAPTVEHSVALQASASKGLDIEISRSSLPGTWLELDAGSKHYGGTFLLGNTATLPQLKARAAGVAILHFSTHAQANWDDPMQSALLLSSSGPEGSEERLFAHQLHGMVLPAQLAILSACETGTGQLDKGEGALSLGRAFLYAGCKSVLMNLWKVDDAGSAAISEHFYEALSTGSSVPEALRAAKLATLATADELTAHPYFWGGGMAIGASRIPASHPFPNWLWALLALPLVLLGWWLKKRI